MNTREENVLFSLSGIELDKATAGLMLENPSSINWQLILDNSRALGSILLVYSNLNRLGLWDKIDIRNKDRLKDSILAAGAANLVKLRHFVAITKKLNAIGIRPMPLKGLSLNIDTYSDAGIRYSCDIDILLDKKDIPPCADILKECGYTLRANYTQEVFFHNKQSMVDVHYLLLPWHEERHLYKICTEDILSRSREMGFEGCRIRMMDKNDQILYTAVICARNGYKVFRYYMDIDAIVRAHGQSLGWDYIYAKAGSMQFTKKLYKIFSFLVRRMHTPIPLPENIKAARKTFGVDFFAKRRRLNFNLFTFFESPTVKDKVSLVLIYLKWQCFLRFGLFKNCFNPKICILDEDVFMRSNKK